MSSSNPLVSILAVSYNHSKWVEETLESIRLQTYDNIQLVILDDCSTDNTVALIQEWIDKHKVDCIFIAHKENQGVCKTYNEGVKLCTGKYYSTISCDDALFPEKTHEQVAFFEKQNENTAMIYSDAIIYDDETKSEKSSFIQHHRKDDLKPSGDIFEDLLSRNYIPAMSILVRKNVFIDLGGFDETLIFEDYDFFLRLSQKHEIVYFDKVLVKYRMHQFNFHKKLGQTKNYFKSKATMYLKFVPYSIIAQQQLELLIAQMDNKLNHYNNHLDKKKTEIELLNKHHHAVILSWRYKYSSYLIRLLTLFSKKNISDKNHQKFLAVYKTTYLTEKSAENS